MKQVTFRELQTNTKWLKELPIEVIRYGMPIAVIRSIDEKPTLQFTKTPKEVAEKLQQQKLVTAPIPKLCPKHGVLTIGHGVH